MIPACRALTWPGPPIKPPGLPAIFADLNDDELIGTLRAFDRMEAWSAGRQYTNGPMTYPI